jgi:hypothetical protein
MAIRGHMSFPAEDPSPLPSSRDHARYRRPVTKSTHAALGIWDRPGAVPGSLLDTGHHGCPKRGGGERFGQPPAPSRLAGAVGSYEVPVSTL